MRIISDSNKEQLTYFHVLFSIQEHVHSCSILGTVGYAVSSALSVDLSSLLLLSLAVTGPSSPKDLPN
jgi:hypothetical protein